MTIGANINPCDKRPSAAFTLAEVIVAVAIFAIIFLAAYSGTIQGTSLIQTTRENERATQILLDKAEVLRLYTWDQLTNTSFTSLSFSENYNPSGSTNYNSSATTNGSVGPTYYGAVTISPAPLNEIYSNDMRMLTFRVLWTNNDLSHQRQLTTLVSRYGMHNYIFGPTN